MTPAGAGSEKVTIISIDTHASPPLDVLRPYCSKKYLDEYDAYAAAYSPSLQGVDPMSFFNESYLTELATRAGRPLMHYDPVDRLPDMDADGIAAEVVFHGALNGEPIPFTLGTGGVAGIGTEVPASGSKEAELAVEGFRIFHRWLEDYCAAAPERRCGLMHIPYWDVDASVAILKEGRSDLLRGVNLPAPRRGVAGYHNSYWEPLWATCADLDLPMNCHGGFAAVDMPQLVGENSGPLTEHDLLYWTRRTMFFLLMGGVFARHPDLKFVLTEQPGGWVASSLAELDATAYGPITRRPEYAPKLPSDFFRSNCYIGASFMSRADVAVAIRDGLEHQMMWGADYPHPEGTYPYTQLSLRYALEGVESEELIRALLGGNAGPLYGFDMDALAKVADRVGPTIEELRVPLAEDAIPVTASAGFRRGEGWV